MWRRERVSRGLQISLIESYICLSVCYHLLFLICDLYLCLYVCVCVNVGWLCVMIGVVDGMA